MTIVFLVKTLILMMVHVKLNVLQLDIMKIVLNGNVKYVIQLVPLVILEKALLAHSVLIVNSYLKTPV